MFIRRTLCMSAILYTLLTVLGSPLMALMCLLGVYDYVTTCLVFSYPITALCLGVVYAVIERKLDNERIADDNLKSLRLRKYPWSRRDND